MKVSSNMIQRVRFCKDFVDLTGCIDIKELRKQKVNLSLTVCKYKVINS